MSEPDNVASVRRWRALVPRRDTGQNVVARLPRLWRGVDSLSLLPLLVSFFALRAVLARGGIPLGFFDEALLFTDAYLMKKGFVVYRDFHFCYPPGILYIVRAVMALHLPPIWTVRLLAFVVRLATGVAAGYLVGRAQGSRFCPWACAAVLAMQELLGLTLYAYPVALLLGMLVILHWPSAGAPRWHAIAAGVAFGGISYLRHDLFVYAGVQLCCVEAAWWLWKRESFFMESSARLRDFIVAVVGCVFLLWAPVFVQSGFARPIQDIVVDLATRIMPGRSLPIPSLLAPQFVAPLNIELPGFLAEVSKLGLAIGIAGCAALLLAIAVRTRRALRANELRAMLPRLRTDVLVLAFALSAIPQATKRFDYPHVAYGVPITITALLLAVGPGLRMGLVLVSLLPWLSLPPSFIGWDAAKQLWTERTDDRFVPAERREVVDYVRQHTKPGDRIFSACYTHRRTLATHLDFYYLSRRAHATQFIIFDPGTTNSEDGQREMIADLGRTRPKLVLRGPHCVWDEPNESLNEGSTLLDSYLEQHYAFDTQVGQWQIWRPKSPS
jgi:hypothetical protein